MTYYNEIDPFAAAWLRELIKAGLIADGEVDERSIADVQPEDVRGFTQCHFFAGIGGWSYALRLAGWPDDRPVWTGSCPCQPFSSAGKQVGGRDDRHLWPHWARLIRECRPVTVFGEQVESAVAHGWLDLVFDDLEREGYACGAASLPAASVGAFHLRQRVWFVAQSNGWQSGDSGLQRSGRHLQRAQDAAAGERVAESLHSERRPFNGHRENECDGQDAGRAEAHGQPGACGEVRDVADRSDDGRREERPHGRRLGSGDGAKGWPAGLESGGYVGGMADAQDADRRRGERRAEAGVGTDSERRRGFTSGGAVGELGDTDDTGPQGWLGAVLSERAGQCVTLAASDVGDMGHAQVHGHKGRHLSADRDTAHRTTEASAWADVEWIACRDGKARPVEPTIQPLASGISNRVGLLRGAGNAIVPQVAAEFIGAYLEVTP